MKRDIWKWVAMAVVIGCVVVIPMAASETTPDVGARAEKAQTDVPARSAVAPPKLVEETEPICAEEKAETEAEFLELQPPAWQPVEELCSHHATNPPCAWCPPGVLRCDCLCNLELTECQDACGQNPSCIFQCVQEANCCMDQCRDLPC